MHPPVAGCVVGFKVDKHKASELSCSGIFITDSIVIAPACILANSASDNQIQNGTFSIAYFLPKKDDNQELITCEANLISIWTCRRLVKSFDLLFSDHDIKLLDEKQEADKALLSKFVILEIAPSQRCRIQGLISTLICETVIGDRLMCCSAPFGLSNPYVFMNTWTTGIVANHLYDASLILCDISCVPGCQGGIVYKLCGANRQLCAVAMILHPVTWRNEEPSGLCVAGSLPVILSELSPLLHELDVNVNFSFCDYGAVESLKFDYLVKVSLKSSWGTGIMLSNCYILTCAHIIKENRHTKPKIRHKLLDEPLDSTVIYCSQTTENFDVAILKLDTEIPLHPPICIADSITVGERVYACGYGIFKDRLKPLVTSGVLAKILPSAHSMIISCHVHAGSSGGAVVNSRNELIGLLTAHMLDHAQNIVYTNISFGIPLNSLKDAITSLTKSNSVNGFLELEKSCLKISAKL